MLDFLTTQLLTYGCRKYFVPETLHQCIKIKSPRGSRRCWAREIKNTTIYYEAENRKIRRFCQKFFVIITQTCAVIKTISACRLQNHKYIGFYGNNICHTRFWRKKTRHFRIKLNDIFYVKTSNTRVRTARKSSLPYLESCRISCTSWDFWSELMIYFAEKSYKKTQLLQEILQLST